MQATHRGNGVAVGGGNTPKSSPDIDVGVGDSVGVGVGVDVLSIEVSVSTGVFVIVGVGTGSPGCIIITSRTALTVLVRLVALNVYCVFC